MEEQAIHHSFHIADLISGYALGSLEPNELLELEDWVNAIPENTELFRSLLDEAELDSLGHEYRSINILSAREQIKKQLTFVEELRKDLLFPSVLEIEAADVRMREVIDKHTLIRQNNSSPLWPRLVAAASIVICIGIGFYFYQKNQATPTEITAKNDIAPGGNKAFLTLADGKRIALTDAKTGELTEQSGVKITKTADGQLIYTVSNPSNGSNKTNDYNTIETPRGGTYQVRLPDGTKVWLNAASTFKYPVSFTSIQARRVTLLSGEAYFEVAKDKKHPFIVQTDQQEVEVLGTHFNINNYSDESFIKTTLFEGSVRISPIGKDGTKDKSAVLMPNQQALLSDKTLKVTDADIDSDIAWKNQEFVFNKEPIQSIMRKLARWYDIEVYYIGDCSDLYFDGMLSRTKNISKILKLMENTGNVNFKLDGRKITVSK